jgi:hypothetical protein
LREIMRQRPFARIARQRQVDYVLGKGGRRRQCEAREPELRERGAARDIGRLSALWLPRWVIDVLLFGILLFCSVGVACLAV